MSRRFHPPARLKLDDETAEQVRRSHDEAIRELQGISLLRGKAIPGVELPDAKLVAVPHGLGRIARVLWSPPYSLSGTPATGHIRDRSREFASRYDPAQYLVLQADNWGVTMYVDLWVY